jgi:hypothetical protein
MHAKGLSAVFMETLGAASLLMAAPGIQELTAKLANGIGTRAAD